MISMPKGNELASDYCLMPNGKFYSYMYIMLRTSYILMK
jgi:hypothetical protein